MSKDIYRDVAGRRRPRKEFLDKDEQQLGIRLAQAGVDWNDPLSAASFERWHDHLSRPTDRVTASGPNLLVLSTETTRGSVRSESLTIRLNNFHPVARSLNIDGEGTIEIAEVSYEFVPWDPASDQWFEPLPTSEPSSRHIGAPRLIPSESAHRSGSQIDTAVLGALLALQDVHADTERLQVAPVANGVEVKGVVETEARKRQIEAALRSVPDVLPDISTYKDLDEKASDRTRSNSVVALSITSGESKIDLYCSATHISQDLCRQASSRFLSSSTVLIRESKRLSELDKDYPPSKLMSARAQTILAELRRGHIEHLKAAVLDQESAFELLGLDPVPKQADSSAPALTDIAQRNQDLIRELTYPNSDHSRPAENIFQELATSIYGARSLLARVSYSAADHAQTSPTPPTPHSD